MSLISIKESEEIWYFRRHEIENPEDPFLFMTAHYYEYYASGRNDHPVIMIVKNPDIDRIFNMGLDCTVKTLSEWRQLGFKIVFEEFYDRNLDDYKCDLRIKPIKFPDGAFLSFSFD